MASCSTSSRGDAHLARRDEEGRGPGAADLVATEALAQLVQVDRSLAPQLQEALVVLALGPLECAHLGDVVLDPEVVVVAASGEAAEVHIHEGEEGLVGHPPEDVLLGVGVLVGASAGVAEHGLGGTEGDQDLGLHLVAQGRVGGVSGGGGEVNEVDPVGLDHGDGAGRRVLEPGLDDSLVGFGDRALDGQHAAGAAVVGHEVPVVEPGVVVQVDGQARRLQGGVAHVGVGRVGDADPQDVLRRDPVEPAVVVDLVAGHEGAGRRGSVPSCRGSAGRGSGYPARDRAAPPRRRRGG
jgi:hypothetical protein